MLDAADLHFNTGGGYGTGSFASACLSGRRAQSRQNKAKPLQVTDCNDRTAGAGQRHKAVASTRRPLDTPAATSELWAVAAKDRSSNRSIPNPAHRQPDEVLFPNAPAKIRKSLNPIVPLPSRSNRASYPASPRVNPNFDANCTKSGKPTVPSPSKSGEAAGSGVMNGDISHSKIVPSELPLARVRPSGENDTELTPSVWAAKTAFLCPLATSRKRTVL